MKQGRRVYLIESGDQFNDTLDIKICKRNIHFRANVDGCFQKFKIDRIKLREMLRGE